jgi:hypothetical protein
MEIHLQNQIKPPGDFLGPFDTLERNGGELYYDDQTVIWMQGNVPKQRITIENESIQECMFGYFHLDDLLRTKKPIRALVVRTALLVRFYFDNGEYYVISIPFGVRKMWPLDYGLLIEKLEKGPVLYTLIHPHSPIQPIKFEHIQSDVEMDPFASPIDSSMIGSVRNVYVRKGYGFLSLFDIHTRTLSVYRYGVEEYSSMDSSKALQMLDLQYYDGSSTLHLELFFRTALTSDPENHFFVTTEEQHDVLWVVTRLERRVLGYPLTKMSTPKYHFTVLNAVPVAATSPDKNNFLALLPDHSLKLWIGNGRFVPCSLIQKNSNDSKMKRKYSDSSEKRKSSFLSTGRDRRVVDLNPASGSEILFVFSDYSICCGSLSFSISSQLANSCMKALHYALPEHLYLTFQNRFYLSVFGKFASETNHTEWEIFVICFFSFFHNQLSLSEAILAENEDDDPWNWLVSSKPFSYLNKQLPLIVKQNGLGGVVSHNETLETLFKQSKALYLQHHTEPSFCDFSREILIVLHFVYEDLLLNTTLERSVNELGSLLLHFANMVKSNLVGFYLDDGIELNCPNLNLQGMFCLILSIYLKIVLKFIELSIGYLIEYQVVITVQVYCQY